MSFLPSLDSLVQKMTSITSSSSTTKNNAPAPPQPTANPDSPTQPQPPTLLTDDPAYDPSLTSPSAVQLSSSLTHTREISMIEKGPAHVGVIFTPKLGDQRISWALEMLKRERVRSVLDVGCGEGGLLSVLCRPAGTVLEDPIEGNDDDDDDAPRVTSSTNTNSTSMTGRLKRQRSETNTPLDIPHDGDRPGPGRGRGHYESDKGEEDSAMSMMMGHPAGETNGVVNGMNGTNGSGSGSRSNSGERRRFAKSNDQVVLHDLFIHRLGGLDVDPTTIPRAVQATAPPIASSSSSTSDPLLDHDDSTTTTQMMTPYVPPRWQRLEVEIWQGGLEKHNQRLEGYEAIVGMEIIEHLNGPSLAVFPQMIFGTFRPKIVLITTPNFEFNSKFPRSHSHDDECGGHHIGGGVMAGASGGSKGFLDPTGRTERVFRHSDHKLEMTEQEFRDWCESAEEWGYTVETGGIGLSNQPSYHDNDPSRPIYATHTAIFRHTGGAPHRSPRSVRSVRLPFMPASGEEYHAHRLAVRHVHEPRGAGEMYKRTRNPKQESDETVRGIVRDLLRRWKEGQVTLDEVWANDSVSIACAGSKRKLVRALGGIGNCPGETGRVGDQPEWELVWSPYAEGEIRICWKDFVDEDKEEKRRREDWGVEGSSSTLAREVVMSDSSGW